MMSSVQKDLTNRWTDLVLLYNVTSHIHRKVYNYNGVVYSHPPNRNLP